MKWPAVLCESDNVTLCPLRVLAASTAAIYHGMVAYAIGYQHMPISFENLHQYIVSMSTLGGTLGLSVGAKSIMKGDAQ